MFIKKNETARVGEVHRERLGNNYRSRYYMVATCEQKGTRATRGSPLAQAHSLLLPLSLLEALEALEGRDCDEAAAAAAPQRKRCENATFARALMSLTVVFSDRHTSARRLKR